MKKIKVGIIGTGGISSVHIQGYKALDNVELYAACDIDEEKVKKALGKDTPLPENPFDLVFKPEYADKLKSCGIFMLDSPTEVMPAALQYLGKDASSTTLSDYDAALEMLEGAAADALRLFGREFNLTRTLIKNRDDARRRVDEQPNTDVDSQR